MKTGVVGDPGVILILKTMGLLVDVCPDTKNEPTVWEASAVLGDIAGRS